LQEAFSRFEISPPVSNAFPLTKQKAPPESNSPLSFQEGFEIDINLKFYFLKILKWWWCGPFALG
jgi:hypothetical protein